MPQSKVKELSEEDLKTLVKILGPKSIAAHLLKRYEELRAQRCSVKIFKNGPTYLLAPEVIV